MIDKKSRVPLYAQLIDLLVEKIKAGELKEHDKLPSERELCEIYDISRTTIRQAMVELENEGYIYKEHGKGSFVAHQTYTQSLVNMYSFTDEMRKLGKNPRAEILSFSNVAASLKVAKKLHLKEDEKVYEIIRLRLADEEPIIYETTYLPVNDFPGLNQVDLEFSPMYEVFNSKYNTFISSAHESFKAVSISKGEAPYLLDKVGSPALRIERLAFSDSRPIEYTISIARGDKYVYTTVLR